MARRFLKTVCWSGLSAATLIGLLSACGQKTYHPLATLLDLDGPIRYQYHDLGLNPTSSMLAFDGYIVGVEKIPLDRIGLGKAGNLYTTIVKNPSALLEKTNEALSCKEIAMSSEQRSWLPRRRVWHRSGISEKEWDRLSYVSLRTPPMPLKLTEASA